MKGYNTKKMREMIKKYNVDQIGDMRYMYTKSELRELLRSLEDLRKKRIGDDKISR